MKGAAPIRVVIIEDHGIVRAGLKVMLASYPDIEVVGEAHDRDKAFEVAKATRPDVLLVDLQLGETSAVDFLPELLAACGARTLVVTGTSSDEQIRKSIHAGATGLILKNENPEVMVQAIRKVHAGKTWLSSQLRTRTSRVSQRDSEKEKIDSLTAREREIIALLTNEVTGARMAQRLGIAEITVRNHLNSIFSKLEVNNQIELVLYAQRHKLNKPSESSDD
jgi:DNA-binding NarL/FixJ family response regulator